MRAPNLPPAGVDGLRLAALVAASGAMLVLLVVLGRWLTFWYDEWNFILDRPDPSLETLLRPHVDHLSAIPVLIYQVVLRVAGMTSYWPYLAALWACHLATVVLLYRIVSRSAGPWVGTAAALSLLTLGSAFEDLLQAFQLSFLVSTAMGLLAIDRLQVAPRRRLGPVAGAICLVLAVLSSSVGVVVLGLVLAWGLLDRRREVVLACIPAAALYGAWYLTWGRSGQGPIDGGSGDTLGLLWTFLYGNGAAFAGVLGLAPQLYSWMGLVLGLIITARLLVAGARPGPLGAAAILALLAQYGLQAVYRSGLGIEHAARSGYLYPAAIFIWIAVGDAIRRGSPATMAAGTRLLLIGVSVLAVAGNLTQLVGAGGAMRGLRSTELAELRLIESLRDAPGLATDRSPDEVLIPQVTPGRYLAAMDRFGAPRLAIEGNGPSRAIDDLVDPERLNMAAVGMLAPAMAPGGRHSTQPPDHLAADGGELRTTASGCIVADGSGPIELRWQVRGNEGFSIQPVPDHLRLGIRPINLAAAPDAVVAQLGRGLILLPPLPNGDPWYVEADTGASVEVCRGTR